MKRKIALAAVLLGTVWFVFIVRRLLVALRSIGPIPPCTPLLPADIPATAYAEACRAARTPELQFDEFCQQDGELLWTHPTYRCFFVAVWSDNRWVLQRLLKRDGTALPVPNGVAKAIGTFYGLATD